MIEIPQEITDKVNEAIKEIHKDNDWDKFFAATVEAFNKSFAGNMSGLNKEFKDLNELTQYAVDDLIQRLKSNEDTEPFTRS